ncbi:MAG: LPP20 family lipoprotein [Fibrobacterota bacterium]
MIRKLLFFTGVFILLSPSIIGAADWTVSGNDPEYPPELYFVGTGVSVKSLEDAKARAAAQIRNQISVKIKSTLKDSYFSKVKDGKEISTGTDVISDVVLQSEGTLSGVDVIKTSSKGGKYYAFVVLDKQKFTSQCKTEINRLAGIIRSLWPKAEEAVGNGRVGIAVKYYSEILEAFNSIQIQNSLLNAAFGKTERKRLPVTLEEAKAAAGKVLSEVSLKAVSEEDQGVLNEFSDIEPLKAEVLYKGTPVSDMPVTLISDQREPLAQTYTTPEGLAVFHPSSFAEKAPGKFLFHAEISAFASGGMEHITKGRRADFTYVLKPERVTANVSISTNGRIKRRKRKLRQMVMPVLSEFGISHSDNSCADINFLVTADKLSPSSVKNPDKLPYAVDADISASLKVNGEPLFSFGVSRQQACRKYLDVFREITEDSEFRNHVKRLSAAAAGAGCAGSTVKVEPSSAGEAVAAGSGDGASPENASFLEIGAPWKPVTYIDAKKWFYMNVEANSTYLIHIDSENSGSGKYDGHAYLEVYAEDLLTKLKPTRGWHYITDPYRLNTVSPGKVYLKIKGWRGEKNGSIAVKVKKLR